jgi:membrane-associated protease RseP (regulator of RpoE activity)
VSDDGAPAWRRLGLPALLFLATIGTTTLSRGPAFSATLMTILVAHEMGHYLVARRHGVPASLPHFVPLPPVFPLGTLGAVITMRTDRASRTELLDIGAAGPISGFVVAVPLMALGVALSAKVPLESFEGPINMLGDSSLSALMFHVLQPSLPPGWEFEAHPVFVGAWAGFLVTAINLLPMGQLDGGHVLYALDPERFAARARWVFRILVGLGLFGLAVHLPTMIAVGGGDPSPALAAWLARTRPLLRWVSHAYLVWAVLGRMTGLEHPPLSEPGQALGRGRRGLAALCGVIFLLTFMPSPVWLELPP